MENDMSENVWFMILVVVLVILCAGEPDLLDAIIKNVGDYT